jgi:peptide/nickel transport system substrate-binding protein
MKSFFRRLNGKEVLFLSLLSFVIVLSFLATIFSSFESIYSERVRYTGSISEGMIGNDIKDIKTNLITLLYSGLVRKSADKVMPNLAQKILLSEDGLVYKIFLQSAAKFSDSKNIESIDIEKSLEYAAKSNGDLSGIKFKILDNKSFTLTLKKKNSKLLSLLNFPIYPSSIVPSEIILNNTLVTSGPYNIKSSTLTPNTGKSNFILNRYNNGAENKPYLDTLNLTFYTNEKTAFEAFKNKEVQIVGGIAGDKLSQIQNNKSIHFATTTLSNTYTLFINQNKNEALQDVELRKAMSAAIDRAGIVSSVLGGFGAAKSALVPNVSSTTSFSFPNSVSYKGKQDGKPIEISITTLDTEELVKTSEYIANEWKKLGITSRVNVIKLNDLEETLKERNFDILLYGFSVNDVSDYTFFFHSRERNYPKLNIAHYVNKEVDSILDSKEISLSKLSSQLEKDMPVIFLYAPYYVIAVNDKNINPVSLHDNIYEWYSEKEKVLKIFNQNKTLNNIINKIEQTIY